MEEDKQQEGGNLNDNTIKLKEEEVKTSKIENFSFLKRNLLKYRNSEVFLSYALLIALLVFTYIIRSNFFLIPFERDEGIYAYFGKLILEGKIPYKDFYEVKFPGLFYSYALLIKIFGYDVKGLHLGFTFLNLFNIILIFHLSNRFFRPVISISAAIVFSILSLNPNISGFTIQSEHIVIFLLTFGIFLLNIKSRKFRLLMIFASGVFLSLAILVKTTAFIFIIVGVQFLFFQVYTSEKKIFCKNTIVNLSCFLAGGLFPIILFFSSIYIGGSWDEMIYFTIKISGKYATALDFNEAYEYFKNSLTKATENHKVFWYFSLFGFVSVFFSKSTITQKAFFTSLGLLSFLMIIPGFYFYGHYYILILPAASLLFAYFNNYLVTYFNRKNIKPSLLIITPLIFLTFILHFYSLNGYYFKPDYFKVLRSTYSINPFPEAMEIGNWLNKNMKKNETFALIGSEPEIYIYTNRKSLSKHAYFTAIVNNIPEHKKWQREFTSSIETRKPEYFVYFNNPLSLLIQPKTDNYVFKWAQKYISDNYYLVGLADMISPNKTIYRWDNDVKNYKTNSNQLIFIYKLKKLNNSIIGNN